MFITRSVSPQTKVRRTSAVITLTAILGITLGYIHLDTHKDNTLEAPYVENEVFTVSEMQSSENADESTTSFEIAQGDEIIIEKQDKTKPYNLCTISFVDSSRRQIWFPRHCASPGDSVLISSPLGGTVFVSKVRSIDVSKDRRLDGDYRNSDFTAVPITNKNIAVKGNVYSGTAVVPMHNITAGDLACLYGNTTREVTCGVITETSGSSIIISSSDDMEPITQPGDSGGPVWIPGRGFIGSIHGKQLVYPDKDNMETYDYAQVIVTHIPISYLKQQY